MTACNADDFNGDPVGCFQYHNVTNPLYTNTDVEFNGGWRQWEWMCCNEP